MIEPTETEAKETLDEFVEAMLAIAREAKDDPDVLRDAPHGRPVRRLDEVLAARRRSSSTGSRTIQTSATNLSGAAAARSPEGRIGH